LKGKHQLGGSEYWGGLGGRAKGGAVGVGALPLMSFSGPPSPCLFCGLQRMASI
jgi:hypothetical protein